MMREYLKLWADHGQPLSNFLLQHGKEFTIGPNTFAGKRMEAGLCFRNATHLAVGNSSFQYVEGYAAVHGVPLQHAWCIDRDGLIVDPTWEDKPGVHSDYFGVQFSRRYLQRTTLANGYYGLLDPYYARKTFMKLMEGKAKFQT